MDSFNVLRSLEHLVSLAFEAHLMRTCYRFAQSNSCANFTEPADIKYCIEITGYFLFFRSRFGRIHVVRCPIFLHGVNIGPAVCRGMPHTIRNEEDDQMTGRFGKAVPSRLPGKSGTAQGPQVKHGQLAIFEFEVVLQIFFTIVQQALDTDE